MEYNTIGKPQPIISSVDKVTGRAHYTDDLRVHNPLHVKILRSPHASAKIISIATEKAMALSGVKLILTGADFKNTFGVLPISKDESALAKTVVRYIGEPVAAVAAESAAIAEKALKYIDVTYECLTPVIDMRKALDKTENSIHPELKKTTNLHKAVEQNFGDLDTGFKEAEQIVDEFFTFDAVTHAFTEPHATQVVLDGEGNITVYSATQVPYYLHKALAEVLEIPMHRLRVIKPHLGGGFGGKSDPFPHEMIAVKCALSTGRNIRLVFSREEVFYSHHGRHPSRINMKLGYHPKKGITALKGDMLIDGGAYASFGVVTSYYNGVLLQGPYELKNFGFHCDRVYTNKPVCGAMRGHGGVNPRFATEVALDIALTKAKIDPGYGRLDMILKPHSLTPGQFRITSSGLKQGLEKALQSSEWKRKYGKLPYGKGIGVACGFFISGSALPIHWTQMPQSTVRLTIDFDGGVTLYSGASDIGQGSDTMLAQMAAEVLGLPMKMIKVISADTRLTPIDYGSYSSRVTFMAGNAARNAAISIRKQLVEAACEILEIPPPIYASPAIPDSSFDLGGREPDFGNPYLGPNPKYHSDGFTFKDQLITTKQGNKSLNYLDVVRKAMDFQGALQAKGVYLSPKLGGDFKGAGAGLSPSYSFTTFVSEVSVDTETGFIKVDKVTCAHDCGFPLNPLSVQGQLEGSIHMGLGQALMEKMNYSRDGVLQNANFLDYKIPSAFEQPEINIVALESSENEGPFGAKEVGEGALAPLSPSVANALYDAVGIRLTSLPMTPDKVLKAMQQLKEG